MVFAEFRKAIDAAMKETLIEAGFVRTAAGRWNRRRGQHINIIQLQKARAEPSFCVNLGIHYAFLPKVWVSARSDSNKFDVVDCELSFRLTEQGAFIDQWWPMEASSIDRVAGLVRNRALPIFDSYCLDGPIAAMDAKRVESGDRGLLAPITNIRACLLLARLHAYLGNRNRCIEAAEIGMDLIENSASPVKAIGPKVAFKEILKRLG